MGFIKCVAKTPATSDAWMLYSLSDNAAICCALSLHRRPWWRWRENEIYWKTIKGASNDTLVLSESSTFGPRLTVASSEVRVAESAVFAQAADDDGDAGEEEDQTYNDPRHHQRRHQERRLPSRLPLTPAVRVLPMALVGAHCREKSGGGEVRLECEVRVFQRVCVHIGKIVLGQISKIFFDLIWRVYSATTDIDALNWCLNCNSLVHDIQNVEKACSSKHLDLYKWHIHSLSKLMLAKW